LNEAVFFIFIRAEMMGEKFQGDEALKLEVLGFVNHAHAAAAELFDDFVVGDGLAEHNSALSISTSAEVLEKHWGEAKPETGEANLIKRVEATPLATLFVWLICHNFRTKSSRKCGIFKNKKAIPN
jgi:hypothetical protein